MPHKGIAVLVKLTFEEAAVSSLTGWPCVTLPDGAGCHPGCAGSVGGPGRQVRLVSNVTMIYRLYFPGKVQRFISRRQAVCKHTAVCVGESSGLMPPARKRDIRDLRPQQTGCALPTARLMRRWLPSPAAQWTGPAVPYATCLEEP